MWYPEDIDNAIRAAIDAAEPNTIPIAEPPCKSCRHWNPAVFVTAIDSKGVPEKFYRMCHAGEMYPDFSCYEAKPTGGTGA